MLRSLEGRSMGTPGVGCSWAPGEEEAVWKRRISGGAEDLMREGGQKQHSGPGDS